MTGVLIREKLQKYGKYYYYVGKKNGKIIAEKKTGENGGKCAKI